jgi:hypothetical protein
MGCISIVFQKAAKHAHTGPNLASVLHRYLATINTFWTPSHSHAENVQSTVIHVPHNHRVNNAKLVSFLFRVTCVKNVWLQIVPNARIHQPVTNAQVGMNLFLVSVF